MEWLPIDETVDRRAVQEEYVSRESVLQAIHRHRLTMDGRAASHMLDDIFATVLELPSSNAQAVAFDDAAILRALHAWFEDPKATHDLPESFKKRMRCAIHALCVCSGDAKEADK